MYELNIKRKSKMKILLMFLFIQRCAKSYIWEFIPVHHCDNYTKLLVTANRNVHLLKTFSKRMKNFYSKNVTKKKSTIIRKCKRNKRHESKPHVSRWCFIVYNEKAKRNKNERNQKALKKMCRLTCTEFHSNYSDYASEQLLLNPY